MVSLLEDDDFTVGYYEWDLQHNTMSLRLTSVHVVSSNAINGDVFFLQQ